MSKRNTALDDLGDPDAPPGSIAWTIAVSRTCSSRLKDYTSSAKFAGTTLLALKKHRGWHSMGFVSFDAFLIDQFDITEQQAELLMDAHESRTVGQVLGKHGGDRKSEKAKDQGSNTTLVDRGRDYTMARLRRDNPELAAQVEAGELSANAAAIQAGFRHPTCSVVTDDVEKAVTTLLKHYSKADIRKALK